MSTIFYFLFSISYRIFTCKLLVQDIGLAKLLLYRRRATFVDSVLVIIIMWQNKRLDAQSKNKKTLVGRQTVTSRSID